MVPLSLSSQQLFSNLRFISVSTFNPYLRYICSDYPESQNARLRSRNESKTAKTMANLINSKPWSNALVSFLPTPLSKTTVLRTLRLIRDPSKALRFFKWAQQSGFSHTAQSYFILLQILGRHRNLNVARNLLFSIEKKSNGTVKLEDRFFNTLIRSYAEAGLFKESLKLFQTMKSVAVSPSVVTFNSVLSILLKRGRTNMAKEVYDEMLHTYGVSPDTCTYNVLIRGLCKNSMVDEGFRFFKEMASFNCDPDVVTYNTLVDGLCRAGKVRIARNLVNAMSKKCEGLNPNVVTYTTLIRGYCMKQEVDEALVVLEEMSGRGIEPNMVTYNTLIKGLCEVHKLDKMKDVLELMKDNGGFSPDTFTFNTIIHSHCCAGNLDEALKVFESMKKFQIRMDSASYSPLIRCLCQKGDYDMAEVLFDELFEKEILLSNFGSKPLAASYSPLIQYLCEHGKSKKAERVMRQLMKRGTQDGQLYNTLIMGHCKEGTYESGYELLVWMLRRDFLPDVHIYDSLIDGFLLKNKPLLAKETLEKMLKSSYQPKTATWHSILAKLLEKGCAHESACVILMMLEKNVRQNINLSTESLKLLFRCGQQERAFEIIDLLYKNGYRVTIEEVVQFLFERGKLSEACKMLFFSFKNHQNVNIDLCNAIVLNLCKTNKVSEAFNLCYELVEKGLCQELTCLNDLLAALEEGGRREEAIFISKRLPRLEKLDESKGNHGSKKFRPIKV
ncbi:pentatricopeptide repeat-containing protein At1g02060, chloroplastic isoform X2 [Vigna radiata var. radiata]|uniref:Pentatricopeptide repeat-containing protein At1g02060, chloroplastic isoform X2 n=1 Tax=Vigna radiata var. radiata TaxID=3916 RepID=A0A1S3U8R7_VIGRR|nr:pentatricopeptide repeat-containing protein At1g02060, chloroplastic isoform X2 [Vigna radiata var. radiata]